MCAIVVVIAARIPPLLQFTFWTPRLILDGFIFSLHIVAANKLDMALD